MSRIMKVQNRKYTFNKIVLILSNIKHC